MANVTYNHVYKRWGDIVAVNDLTLKINDKEFLVFVGPSGCGKSTSLRLLAGLEELSEGDIYIDDRMVNDVPPKDRDIAMVFQSYALYPHMSVFDNMAFGLKLRKVPKDEIKIKVKEAADILGISQLLDRKPKQLSGGQRQRVAVGRAIVRDPAVFLFDEPLSNLDAKLRVQTRSEISKLHMRLGTTFIYVTHDQVEAMTLGNRIAVIRRGVAEQVGDPATLYDSPANQFVAGFIGMPSMNFFDGAIDGSGDGSGGSLVFRATAGFSLPMAGCHEETLRALSNKPVTLGVRPEHIEVPATGLKPGAARLRAVVELVEPMGAESYVHLRAGTDRLVCRTASREKLARGAEIDLAVDIDKVHFFDSETAARLTRSSVA